MKKKFISLFCLLGIALGASGCNNNNPHGLKRDDVVPVLTAEGAKRVNAYKASQHKALKEYGWIKAAEGAEAKAGDLISTDMRFEVYPSEIVINDDGTVLPAEQLLLVGFGQDIVTKRANNLDDVNSLIAIECPAINENPTAYEMNGEIFKSVSLEYNTVSRYTVKYEFISKSTSATTAWFCQPSFNLALVDNEAPHTNKADYKLSVGYKVTGKEVINMIKTEIQDQFTTNDPSLTLSTDVVENAEAIDAAIANSIQAAKDAEDHKFTKINLNFVVSASNGKSTDNLICELDLIDDVAPYLIKGVATDRIEDFKLFDSAKKIDLTRVSVFKAGVAKAAKDAGYKLFDEIEGTKEIVADDIKITKDGKAAIEVSREDFTNYDLVESSLSIRNYNKVVDGLHYYDYNELGYILREDDTVEVSSTVLNYKRHRFYLEIADVNVNIDDEYFSDTLMPEYISSKIYGFSAIRFLAFNTSKVMQVLAEESFNSPFYNNSGVSSSETMLQRIMSIYLNNISFKDTPVPTGLLEDISVTLNVYTPYNIDEYTSKNASGELPLHRPYGNQFSAWYGIEGSATVTIKFGQTFESFKEMAKNQKGSLKNELN